MTHILQELSFYLSYPFVRYALIVGVLIALCSSLLGVTLVLKRFSLLEMDSPMSLLELWQLLPFSNWLIILFLLCRLTIIAVGFAS